MALSPLALFSPPTSNSSRELPAAHSSDRDASAASPVPDEALSRDPSRDVSAGSVFSRRRAHSRKYDPWKDIYVQGGFSPNPADTSHEPSAVTEETRRRSGDYYDYVEDTADYYDPYADVTYTNSADDDSGDKQKDTDRVDRPRPTVFIGPENRPSGYESSLQSQQQPSFIRRMSNALRDQTGLLAVLAFVAGLLALGAAYWLFVVNGPTPVVKARKEEDGNGHDVSETLSLVTGALLHILAGQRQE